MKPIERNGYKFRFNLVSRIERTWLRRFWLAVLFIPLLFLNWILAAISIVIALPLLVIRGAWLNTITLVEQTLFRWYVRKDD